MNIVQISGYYPPHLGGSEACAKNIAEQLARNGHQVMVLTSNIDAGKARTVPKQNLTVRYLRGFEFAHTPFTFGLPWALARLPRNNLLHVHLSHVFTELSVWAVAKIRRMPYVAHFHMDVSPSGRLGFLFDAYKKTLLPFVIRGAAKVIALSDEQRDIVVSRYGVKPENAVVIPNGVGQEYFVDVPKQPNDIPALLFVGRFALQKNIPRLLNALPLMKHKVQLHIVGDGEKRQEVVDTIAQLGLANVTLYGTKYGAELIDLYHQADIFVIPSDREGMPLTLLEAAASGLPVVASNVQGLREHVTGLGGVLVDQPAPSTFAATLDALLDNPTQLRHMARTSRAWAEHLAWPNQVAKIERLYSEVADA